MTNKRMFGQRQFNKPQPKGCKGSTKECPAVSVIKCGGDSGKSLADGIIDVIRQTSKLASEDECEAMMWEVGFWAVGCVVASLLDLSPDKFSACHEGLTKAVADWAVEFKKEVANG
jgi:hypothetical protein